MRRIPSTTYRCLFSAYTCACEQRTQKGDVAQRMRAHDGWLALIIEDAFLPHGPHMCAESLARPIGVCLALTPVHASNALRKGYGAQRKRAHDGWLALITEDALYHMDRTCA